MFEAQLWAALRQVAPGSYALAEGESRHIGRLSLPVRVHQALQTEVSIWIEVPLTTRVNNILADYPARDELREEFAGPIRALKERLGRQVVEELDGLLREGRWDELVRQLMSRYYDPLYQHTFPERRIEVVFDDEAAGLTRLKAAIAQVLSHSSDGGVAG
jgi:tRNA 2-selenouridine synthase